MGILDGARQQPALQALTLVGCDDVPQAAWPAYRLTTIAQPVSQLAQQAVHQLLQHVEGMPLATSHVTYLPPTLICRS